MPVGQDDVEDHTPIDFDLFLAEQLLNESGLSNPHDADRQNGLRLSDAFDTTYTTSWFDLPALGKLKDGDRVRRLTNVDMEFPPSNDDVR
jgi:hypothetical protein